LDEEDVIRHRLVKSIIKAYNFDDAKNTKEKEGKIANKNANNTSEQQS
jgi:phosphate starvation-inducible protein PhoH